MNRLDRATLLLQGITATLSHETSIDKNLADTLVKETLLLLNTLEKAIENEHNQATIPRVQENK